MYEVFEKLMHQRGLNINKVAKAVGISPSTLTDWRAGRYTPKADKRQKIADFLGVSLHYLDTGEYEDTVPVGSEDQNYLQIIRDNPQMKALLAISKDLDEDDFNAVKDYAERLRRSYKE